MNALRPLFLLCAGLAACTVASNGSDSSDSAETSSNVFPAFKPDIGTLKMGSGPVLHNAKIVTITYPTDPWVQQLEAFSDQIGPSQFWKTVTSEYGVGPTISDPSLHVHLNPSDLPQLTDGTPAGPDDPQGQSLLSDDLETYIVDHATRASETGWPGPEDETLYVMYVPADVPLTSATGENRQDACNDFDGYHDEKIVGGKHILFAIIYEKCEKGGLDDATDTASHELAEAATDPWESDDSTAALNGFDDEHLAWSLFNQKQEENGDACQFYDDANVKLGGDLPFRVQSLWSNQSALAGHNPCVPSDPFEQEPSVYYNVTPLKMQDVSVVISKRGVKTSTIAPVTTKGYAIGPDNTVDFEVGFYSDKSTDGSWTLTAQVGPIWEKSRERRLAVSFAGGAKSVSGKNGKRAKVHVAFDANKTAATKSTGLLVTLISAKDGLPKHYMPVMIAIPSDS